MHSRRPKVLLALVIPLLLSGCHDTHGADKPGTGVYLAGAIFLLIGLLIGWGIVKGGK